LFDTIARIEYWQLILGFVFIFLVVAFPQGIVGYFNNRLGRYFGDNHHPSGSL
jgi:ABC-type branched-subunit amino acid transport system permease subunit